MNIRNAVILVTGANRGLGQSLVKQLLAAGAKKVYAAARDPASWLSIPSSATYSASKSAAWSLTNGLRGELRGQGTQVVAVHVGYMDTDMTKRLDAPKVSPDDVARQVVEALASGSEEVLADELSRNVRRGLSADRAVYLGEK